MTTPTERIQALRLSDEDMNAPYLNSFPAIADAQFEKLLKGLAEIVRERRAQLEHWTDHWILDDVVDMMEFALEKPKSEGPH